MLRLLWSMTAVTVLVGVGAVSTGVASAQKDGSSVAVTVDRVDARGDSVVVEGSLTGAEASSLEFALDGERTEPSSVGSLAEVGGRNDVIAVVDNAEILGNATVQLTKEALSALRPSTGATSSLGVVTTGGRIQVPVGPTGSDAAIDAGLGGIAPKGTSLTWDGVARAAALLEDGDRSSVGTVVLFTASPSAPSGFTSSGAHAALQRAGARLEVVALGAGAQGDTLSHMVGVLGGSLTVVDNDEEIAAAYERIAEGLSGRFRATLPAAGSSGEVVPLTVTSGSARAEVGFTPGSTSTGSIALAPVVTDGSSGFISSPVVKWFALLIGLGAVITAVWTLLMMVLPSENNLDSRLEAYEENYGSDEPAEYDADEGAQATVPIIRRAVELTGEMAERRGLLDKVEMKLERANLPLRAAEAMFFTAATAVILTALTFVMTGNPISALIAGVAAILVPVALLNLRVRRRQKAFVALLPDMLTLLAGTLKAGYSIGQGFESVSNEIDEPMGRELRRVVTESRLGRSLEESLEAVAERMDSDDFGWAVMAIKIQREVGGNLAELLMTVADTMTQRERLRRDVATLTAEGRISAVIIGLLPPGLAVALYFMNPGYIGALFTPGLGYGLVVGTLITMGIGFAWMKKTITIEV
jgi:tight adherence protein B